MSSGCEILPLLVHDQFVDHNTLHILGSSSKPNRGIQMIPVSFLTFLKVSEVLMCLYYDDLTLAATFMSDFDLLFQFGHIASSTGLRHPSLS